VCKFCRNLGERTVETAFWLHTHAEHGTHEREEFKHPSGRWFWLVCPCGAKHMAVEERGSQHEATR
jgi:hypothetical protein